MKIFRSILGVIVGIVLFLALLMSIEGLGHSLYPPPDSIRIPAEKRDMAALSKAVGEWLPTAPLAALVFPVLGWMVGTFAGCLAAAWIAGRAPLLHAGITAVLPFIGTVANLAMIPQHPVWMWVAGVAGVPLAAIAAGLLGPRQRTSGPQPQDMRQKNMAC